MVYGSLRTPGILYLLITCECYTDISSDDL